MIGKIVGSVRGFSGRSLGVLQCMCGFGGMIEDTGRGTPEVSLLFPDRCSLPSQHRGEGMLWEGDRVRGSVRFSHLLPNAFSKCDRAASVTGTQDSVWCLHADGKDLSAPGGHLVTSPVPRLGSSSREAELELQPGTPSRMDLS